jgi:hypothetical protein
MNTDKRVITTIALVATLLAGVAGLRLTGASSGVDALSRAQEAGEEARSNQERIEATLREIASNLSGAGDLGSSSAEIRALTQRQRDSLARLARLLEDQLEALARASGSVSRAGASTAALSRLGAIQTQRLKRALAALRLIRALARDASAQSARLAQNTRYGARLARDSYRNFSQ